MGACHAGRAAVGGGVWRTGTMPLITSVRRPASHDLAPPPPTLYPRSVGDACETNGCHAACAVGCLLPGVMTKCTTRVTRGVLDSCRRCNRGFTASADRELGCVPGAKPPACQCPLGFTRSSTKFDNFVPKPVRVGSEMRGAGGWVGWVGLVFRASPATFESPLFLSPLPGLPPPPPGRE
jgi:hypothetical protein